MTMKWKSWLAAACAAAGFGCGTSDSTQVLTGRVTSSAIAVRAVADGSVVTAGRVRRDGTFTLSLPAGKQYQLEVMSASGAVTAVADTAGTKRALTFKVCQPGAPWDMGGMGGKPPPPPPPCDPTTDPNCKLPPPPCDPADPNCPPPPPPPCDPTTDPNCKLPPPPCDPSQQASCPPPPPPPCADPTDPNTCKDPCMADPASCGCGDPTTSASGSGSGSGSGGTCWPPPDPGSCDGSMAPQHPPGDFGCDDGSGDEGPNGS